MRCEPVAQLHYRLHRQMPKPTHARPKVQMLPHDPMTWLIMLGNVALLIVLYRLIRGRRTS
jgi:hypothetical protein